MYCLKTVLALTPVPFRQVYAEDALTKGNTNYSKGLTHSEIWQSDSNSLCTKTVKSKVTRCRQNVTEAWPRTVLTFSLRLFLALLPPPELQSVCKRITHMIIQFTVSVKGRFHSLSLRQFCDLAPGWQNQDGKVTVYVILGVCHKCSVPQPVIKGLCLDVNFNYTNINQQNASYLN